MIQNSESFVSYEDLEEILDKEGRYVTVPRGVSMLPAIRDGVDPILVSKPRSRLKPYDVAVYRAREKYIVHRVLEVHPDHYVIRGDNCVSKEYVLDSQIVGVMTGFWRGERFIDVTDPGYRRYARFWVAVNPLVRLWHLPRRLASEIFHLIFGKDVHPLADFKRRRPR